MTRPQYFGVDKRDKLVCVVPAGLHQFPEGAGAGWRQLGGNVPLSRYDEDLVYECGGIGDDGWLLDPGFTGQGELHIVNANFDSALFGFPPPSIFYPFNSWYDTHPRGQNDVYCYVLFWGQFPEFYGFQLPLYLISENSTPGYKPLYAKQIAQFRIGSVG